VKLTRATILCAAACGPTRGPIVVPHFVGTWSADDQQRVVDGSGVWDQLGFGGAPSSALPECRRQWYLAPKTTQCKITVEVSRQTMDQLFVGDETTSAVADQDHRTVIIDPKWHGWDLLAIAAHEFGHILLDSHHLAPGKIGVMQAKGALWTPTQDDYDLACSTIKICIHP